jgi:hypothetical protein
MDGAVTLRILATVSFVALAVGGAGAQQPLQSLTPSLADIARQAEAAKPTTRKATRTYTNGSLASVPRDASVVAAPPAVAAFESRSLGKVVPAEELLARSEAKIESDKQQSEPTWRGQAESLRKQIDDIRSRISAMMVPNALTDADPVIKKSNDIDIANARKGLDGLLKQWAKLEASASEAKIPSAWLDPRPARE